MFWVAYGVNSMTVSLDLIGQFDSNYLNKEPLAEEFFSTFTALQWSFISRS